MARILVTGGAGFIGSHIAEELSKDGSNEIVVLDNLATANKLSADFVKNLDIEFIEGSVTDAALLLKTLEDVDYVLHQAAIPSVPRSVKDPLASNAANVGGTLSLLKASLESGVKKVVCASSSSVYGDTPTLPKVETMTPNPKSPYAISKLMGEHYCRVFDELYGLETVSLRYFNVFGPRQNPFSEYSAVMPKFIYAALQDKPLRIYGDGSQTRDFTYVKDVVRANILAAGSDATGVFNIAGGRQISIQELAESIIELTGSASEVEHLDVRQGDILHSLADISKARDGLGWKPDYTLQQGLAELVNYVKPQY